MRALFFGTPEIAVPALDALGEVAEVVGVVCQPDRPAGRGMKLRPPPVKERALALGLEVVQPTKIRRGPFVAWVQSKQADVALVIAYGRILRPNVLTAPRCGCMNLHASLLPHYRGAAPINWAIVRGEKETGVCLMQMDEGMDTGPVFSTHRMAIAGNETAGELYQRLGQLAADVVRSDLRAAVQGDLVAQPQEHAAHSHAPMLSKSDGRIDWSQPAPKVHDHARGMTPWPGAHTLLDGKLFKVLRTRPADGPSGGVPGRVVAIEKGRVFIACGEGRIELLRAQLAGRKALDAAQLVSGRSLAEGMRLGEWPNTNTQEPSTTS
jgi:methionyl-tRNA formyltransferase